jgi:hypothetical protein
MVLVFDFVLNNYFPFNFLHIQDINVLHYYSTVSCLRAAYASRK